MPLAKVIEMYKMLIIILNGKYWKFTVTNNLRETMHW